MMISIEVIYHYNDFIQFTILKKSILSKKIQKGHFIPQNQNEQAEKAIHQKNFLNFNPNCFIFPQTYIMCKIKTKTKEQKC